MSPLNLSENLAVILSLRITSSELDWCLLFIFKNFIQDILNWNGRKGSREWSRNMIEIENWELSSSLSLRWICSPTNDNLSPQSLITDEDNCPRARSVWRAVKTASQSRHIFCCEGNSRYRAPWLVSESVLCHTFQYHYYEVISESQVTSIWHHISMFQCFFQWISIKTLKNQSFTTVGHSGVVPFSRGETRTAKQLCKSNAGTAMRDCYWRLASLDGKLHFCRLTCW